MLITYLSCLTVPHVFSSKRYLNLFLYHELNFFRPPIVSWVQVVTQTQLTILFGVFKIRNLVMSIQPLVCGQGEGATELGREDVSCKFDEGRRFEWAVQ